MTHPPAVAPAAGRQYCSRRVYHHWRQPCAALSRCSTCAACATIHNCNYCTAGSQPLAVVDACQVSCPQGCGKGHPIHWDRDLCPSCSLQAAASALPPAFDRAWEAIGGGPADLIFPELFLGRWVATSTLVKLETPLGADQLPPALVRAVLFDCLQRRILLSKCGINQAVSAWQPCTSASAQINQITQS